MIILKVRKCKHNIKALIEKYKTSLDIKTFDCPNCNSDDLIKWGTYERNIYYIEKETIIYKTITIQRVKCKKCNHTHALLIEYIIPYKQYLLDVILSSISNESLTNNYFFSVDTINKWKYQFTKYFLPYLRTMLRNIENIISYILNNIFDMYETFYKINHKIILMIRHGVMKMSYF